MHHMQSVARDIASFTSQEFLSSILNAVNASKLHSF